LHGAVLRHGDVELRVTLRDERRRRSPPQADEDEKETHD